MSISVGILDRCEVTWTRRTKNRGRVGIKEVPLGTREEMEGQKVGGRPEGKRISTIGVTGRW